MTVEKIYYQTFYYHFQLCFAKLTKRHRHILCRKYQHFTAVFLF